LLPLAAVLAVVFPFASTFYLSPTSQQTPSAPDARSATQNQPVAESNKQGKSKLRAPDANKILSEFFGVNDYHRTSLPKSDFRSRYSVQFMIATIPDPIYSRLPYLFDRFLASIQRAAATDGLVLDRFYLPWEELHNIEENPSASEPSEPEPFALIPYAKDPGLLLYRDPSGPRVLVLFLVGESPTAGISKNALTSALNQIVQLRKDRAKEVDSHSLDIPILGPTFSGSAESLDFMLHSWSPDSPKGQNPLPVHFNIVSGSATAVVPCSIASDEGRCYFDQSSGLHTFSFQATVVPDNDAFQRFREFLDKRQPALRGPIRIALLMEANTTYGKSLKEQLEKERKPKPSRQNASPTADANLDIVSLPFPLHISRLRSELEKMRHAQAQNSGQTNPDTESSRYLPVPIEDESEHAHDVVPPFSELDISTSELILSNLLSTVSQEQFDYVGIAATDVRDAIFLAREIREHSPSSVIFALNADLIYAHPEANPNTRGMLLVTPYPLFTLNQRWDASNDTQAYRFQFPDQNSEGVYNAMLHLLNSLPGTHKDLLEYGLPFRRLPPIDKMLPNPPLWITTIGRQGFWPVAVLPVPSPDAPLDSTAMSTTADLGRGLIPHSAVFVYLCWTLLCLLSSVVFVRRAFGFATPSGLPDAVFARNREECGAYFLVGSTALVATYIVAVTAYFIASWQISGLNALHSFALVMLGVIALALCACLLLARGVFALAFSRGRAIPNGWLAGPVLLVSTLSVVLAGWLSVKWLLLEHGSRVNGIVTGFRAVNLWSGVSPLPPLFLIALAACTWTYSAVRRVRLAEALPWDSTSECDGQQDSREETTKHALFNSDAASFKTFHALEADVQQLLRCPSLRLPDGARLISFVVLIGIVLIGIYLFYLRLVVGIELPVFYALFGICYVLVYLSIAFNMLRLLFLWLALRRILEALQRHPIGSAFSRFHRSYPDLPRISLASAPSPLTALHFCIQQATTLVRCSHALGKNYRPFAKVVNAAEANIGQAENAYRSALPGDPDGNECRELIAQLKSQRHLARASRQIEDTLERSWKANSACGTADASGEADRRALTEEAEEFLVGRSVLFLSHIFPQMTNLAGLSLVSLLLMLVAVSVYPFQPHQLIVWFNWTLIFGFVAVALYMAVQMNRDTVLSHLNGTKPGELNWDSEFVSRILLYVVIPILGFLGVQFPDALSQVFRLFTPGAAGHP
jgi:hypothetical protein